MKMRFGAAVLCAIAAFAAAAAWSGCGVKSPPIPPQFARPAKIIDLRGASQKGGVMLTWTRPDTYDGGGKMRDLGSFAILRSQAGGAPTQIAAVPVTDNNRFQQQHVFTYLDHEAAIGQNYSYEIISRTTDDYVSQPSNMVSLTRVKPPPPPNPENFVLPTPTPLP